MEKKRKEKKQAIGEKKENVWMKLGVIVSLIGVSFYVMAEHKNIKSFINEVIFGKSSVKSYEIASSNYQKSKFLINPSPKIINNSNIVNNIHIKNNNNSSVTNNNILSKQNVQNIINLSAVFDDTKKGLFRKKNLNHITNGKIIYSKGWYGFAYPSMFENSLKAHDIKYTRLNTNQNMTFNDLCKSIGKKCTTTIKVITPNLGFDDDGCNDHKDEDVLAFCE